MHPGRFTSMSLSLQEIVARGTALDWFEGVAVVQAICAAAPGGAGQEPRIPDLAGVRVAADGNVILSPSGDLPGSAASRAGRTLNALLPEGRTPVPLRLLVLTAISGEPPYRTVPEFSQALDYFERPNRRAVISGVYERAAQLPASENRPAVQPQEAPPPTPAKRNLRPPAWLAAALGLACGAALLVVLAFGGWWWWWTPAPGQPKTVAVGVSTAIRAIEHRLAAILPAAIVPAGWAAEAPAPPVAEARVEPASARPAPRVRPSRRAVTTPDPARVDTPVEAPEVFSRIYSAADGDVLPPVALRSTLPTSPPPGVRQEELSRVEIVVTEAGDVESIKLISGLRRSIDGMLLSALKTWKFQPATKDGRPVPYRQVVWLTSF